MEPAVQSDIDRESVVTMLSQEPVRYSKRVAAAVATVALAFTGLVAGVAAPAQAADNLPMDIRVTRNLDAAQATTIQPGDSVSLNISVTIDARSNGSTVVSDLEVDDIVNFETNFSSTLTPSYSRYSWYITGATGSCYGITFPDSSQLTWTQAMNDCGGGAGAGYLSVYLQASLNNTTSSAVTLSADPKLITPNAPSGLSSTEPGLYDNVTVTLNDYGVTSYTALDEDSSIYIDGASAICVSRDLAAGDAFEAAFGIKQDGVDLASTDDGITPYADNSVFPRFLPLGTTTSELIGGSIDLVGYEASFGSVTLTTASAHNFSSTTVDIAGTGVADLDAIDANYAYAPTTTTLRINGTDVPDTAYTSLTEGTVTGELGGSFYVVPDSNQGIKVTTNAYVYRPAAGAIYTLSGSVVDHADGATSVERQCGPGVPTFTIDTAGSSSSVIAVDIDQVTGADYYQCRAYNSSNVMIYEGYLNETSRAAGTACHMYGLTSSTAYTVKVLAGNSFEGEGQESTGISHTTSAGGGGGGWVPPAMVTPTLLAPGGASTIAVTTPAEKTMNAAITVTDSSRSFAGANGDMFYASVVAGTATIVHNTASGADTKFAGTGKLVIPDVISVSSVTWTGLKGAGFSVVYRKASNGSYEAKWGLMTTASGMKTQEITTAKIAAFCTSAAGAGYNLGGLLPSSSVMTTPFVRVSCMSSSDPNLPERVILANVAASSTSPLVKTSAQPTNYTTSSYPCTSMSISSNKAATSSTAAMLVIATTHAKTSNGGPAYCMQGSGAVLKREVISISGAGKKLVSSIPSSSVIGTDIGIFSAAPGKSVNTWVVLAGTNGGMMSSPATKYILTVDAKAKVVKGKNITYSSASAASNLKFNNYSILGAAAQLSTGTILAVRQGSATGSNNQSWAAVSINLSTGVVTTGKVITVTATEYTGTQQFARNMNMTSFTSDSKKLNVYVLSNPDAKKYKVATWTMPTK
ncbi:MAG: hypothetical protein RLZZ258_170 [Actinomycetota bacterium]|jgi:hypothetical protein